MKKTNITKFNYAVRLWALGMGVCAAFMVESAIADTTIATGTTQTVSGDPLATFWNTAGTVTIDNGGTLFRINSECPPHRIHHSQRPRFRRQRRHGKPAIQRQ